ncbi:hypothetical protein ACGFOU_14820 [Streptomyces sp. NPDC048595]|uniref:hypothetical protein n=1 Tax=Streptomyces sp. NPDC048595 TaxID=3365576 RepID=UPI00371969CB
MEERMAKAADPAAARERALGLGLRHGLRLGLQYGLGLAGMPCGGAAEPLRGIAPAKIIAGLDGG